MDDTLIERLEAASGPDKALDREIALAVGWVRQSPTEARRKHPAWFHPDDCRNGKVIMDSLHGTDVWRDPLAYTASLDAAMTLVPEGYRVAGFAEYDSSMGERLAGRWTCSLCPRDHAHLTTYNERVAAMGRADAATAPLALVIAALKALRAQAGEKS